MSEVDCRLRFFRDQIRLYERRKARAQRPDLFDDVIRAYKGEIAELQKARGVKTLSNF